MTWAVISKSRHEECTEEEMISEPSGRREVVTVDLAKRKIESWEKGGE
jgi:hypothetical protein